MEVVFCLTGRGVVAAGDLVDGTVSAGMWTEPLDMGGAPAPLRVTSVEWTRRHDRPDGRALVFGGLHDPDALERALPADRVLLLTEAPGESA